MLNIVINIKNITSFLNKIKKNTYLNYFYYIIFLINQIWYIFSIF